MTEALFTASDCRLSNYKRNCSEGVEKKEYEIPEADTLIDNWLKNITTASAATSEGKQARAEAVSAEGRSDCGNDLNPMPKMPLPTTLRQSVA